MTKNTATHREAQPHGVMKSELQEEAYEYMDEKERGICKE